ncbi:TIGR04222 domain-containing membrane protein [Rhodococcus sp. 077-4]|uniref:TIGR04222 domain-containing membrane protein n=1 Tax=Rhodococcus sp. 077-4 TaxID=2789271 RepID=UPI0039F61F68
MTGTDTWGISGSDFLHWYLIAAVLAVVLTVLGNWIADKRSVSSAPAVRVLTPPEVGALTSDTQAVLASLAMLRGADVIDSSGRSLRTPTTTELTHLDWFTRIVLLRLGNGTAPLVRSRLFANTSGARAKLRRGLVDEGLLYGRSTLGASTIRVFPILFVVAVGVARVTQGPRNGNPVLFLVGIIALLLLTLPFVHRRRRRTALGEAEVRRLRQENDYLAPSLRPSFTAYGPSRAGMSAALFGTSALMMLDPAMADALSHGVAQVGQAPLVGFGGTSGSGGSDSGFGGDGNGGGCGGGGGGGGGCGSGS